MKRLAGRVAVVTGATRGIGRETALLLGREGASVGVNYAHDDAAAEETVRALRDLGVRAVTLKADVRKSEQVEAAAARAVAELGPVDTLVLNASVARFRPTPVMQSHWSSFEEQLAEVQAAFATTHAFVPAMVSRRNGCVIGVSSALARHPVPGFGAVAASKGALEAFLRSLAVELGPDGVRVNIVEASLVETDASRGVPDHVRDAVIQTTPLRRVASPADVAGGILLLASEEACFVTGATLPVNGGQVMF